MSVNNTSSLSFFTQLELFLVYLNNNNAFNCEKVYNPNIEICIETISTNNSNKCICIVTNVITGVKKQCSRNKKYGNVCGLHHERKNNFKTINNDITSSNKKKYSITLKECAISKDITNKPEYIDINWNSIWYKVDKSNGDVFYNNIEDWEYLDKLSNLNIPISIY